MNTAASCAALALALAATPALAQDTANDEAAAEQEGIGDIIVTAQRTATVSQRTPLAIDVIQPEELTTQQVIRAEDLSRIAPSLAAVGGAGGTTSFFVRGVGNNSSNAYSDPAISFNYDGVYVGRPSSTSGVFYDLQRVEVLKGPQGTLYGRNATAGAINVIPNRPEIGEQSVDFMLGYGNYDWLTGQAAVNVPLGETLAMRASGSVSRRDGFMTDGTGEQREYAGRVQFLYDPGTDLTVRVAADYSSQGGSSPSGFYLGKVDPVFGQTGFQRYDFTPSGFSPDQGLLDPRSAAYVAQRFVTNAGRTGVVIDGQPYNDNEFWGVTAEIVYSTDAGTLTVQPAYREASLDYVFNAVFREGASTEEDQQFSVEARWNGDLGDNVSYLLGGIYFDEDISATARYNQNTLTPFQNFETGTTSWAGFGMVTVRPVENLSLTAAARYTDDKKRFDGLSDVYILFCGNPAPQQDFCPTLPFTPLVSSAAALRTFYANAGVPVVNVPLFALPPIAGGSQTAPFVLNSRIPINATLSNDKVTYRLAAQYDFTPRNMIYASMETGYHAGGFSFARGVESYLPEQIRAWTLGTKNRFLDNRLQVNLEAFWWDYRDQQFSQFGFDLGNPPSTVFLTRNIGDSTIKGLDLDVQVLPTETTTLSANVQYLDTSYDSFVYFAPNQGLPPNTSCPYTPTTQTTPGGATLNVFAIDCSGNQAFNSPKWSLNLDARQVVNVGPFDMHLNAGTRYRGASYSSADYLPYLQARPNFVSYASITFADHDETMFLTFYVNNIENSRRLIGGTATSTGLIVANAEQPQTIGVRLGGSF
ncbi:TonB-dependent receptor [Altererythrobacter buctensis]|uniref:TonB-dependent receptor n=1 Tax=Alteraurantiacibacter buctensis TaxID=1503981 RepID=A0A844YX33_9SPHN|nr:TonB-dependent receptor [Alteraurantiacibacter buctensis]MXO71034.1 TonB-dependent receptor [Alteraurantiacibacter buctensis]